ncbi:PREDICTED: lysosome membrane protein 2-like [Nicrophorus vespilloides]|uniref:Lysosome membrane protein 2-like n=1 Tax=Nicrophorus vespilloides TaxID=110193 RepID=A0ABM1MIM5_NICVS|nr:PREDICTED: lysosome membrane protein 2-like [Nicrophorus vespilloides]
MKDAIGVWSRILGRSYSSVATRAFEHEEDNFVRNAQKNQKRNRDNNHLRKKYKSYFSIALVGLMFVFGGLFVLVANPYDVIFNWKITFSEGGEIFEIWRKPPVDLYLRVFLFNVTNREAFLSGKEKLKVQEVGPYVYREMMSHENITFNENGTVSAVPTHPLVWMPELSVGDHETDQLILPHIALLSIADVVSDKSYFTKLGLNLLIRQTDTHPLVQMSPKEFMFGYPSTLMTLGNKFLPGWINFEKLGLIDRMYNFEGDYETVYTGEEDSSLSGLLDTYNGSPQMPEWKGRCGYVRGASDGMKFQSHIKDNDTLLFFRKSMCRPQYLIKENETFASGLIGNVYRFPKNGMDNGKYDSENSCYCRDNKCLRSGLLDVRECYYGFPIALSYPHFLDSDQSIIDEVDGYVPDRQKHETYFVIQPKSGLPLDLAVRFQINMALGKIGSIAHVSRFDNMVLPLLWTEIRLYSLPDSMAMRFKMYLNVFPVMTTSIMWALFALGITFVLVAVVRYARRNGHRASTSKSFNWADDDVETERMDSKLTAYKKETMTNKELEVYFNSLVAPLNQELEQLNYEPFQDKSISGNH